MVSAKNGIRQKAMALSANNKPLPKFLLVKRDGFGSSNLACLNTSRSSFLALSASDVVSLSLSTSLFFFFLPNKPKWTEGDTLFPFRNNIFWLVADNLFNLLDSLLLIQQELFSLAWRRHYYITTDVKIQKFTRVSLSLCNTSINKKKLDKLTLFCIQLHK